MASNGTNRSLLSGLVDPTPPKSNENTSKIRRYRRCKSAPTADFLPAEIGLNNLQRSASIFGKPHPHYLRMAAYLGVYLSAGTICFYSVKSQITGKKTNGIVDSIYFCIVTMTTVGYGDLVPNSVLAKLLACAFVFAGMGLGGIMLSKAADYLVEKQEILLIKALHRRQKLGPMDMQKEVETNGLRYKCILFLIIISVLIIVGTVVLALVEGMDFVDAFYCVCSTITTLGYGDKSFSTTGGRSFAIIWILTSTISLGRFFLHIAELNTLKRQKKLVNWVLNRRMTAIDLEAADLDGDGDVSAAEFIIYKLREMGKICQEDISPILKEFEDLDVDQSGTLSTSDITLAQNPQTNS
ncbi:two-pore potassium channel 1-like [Pistacia vera]|uniref:two-pore potassium channel 1-like n=1 Tax=Pistacia vera TaxID=55513 RepID=UPI001263C278|nr:two-pore potassium channel 1-like [Pistacia vera]XP_031283744.1 two-pore potassium channel 1-like [Pistacia vera]XP_031283745.1 two-pore potassium channel 1-like [Pistacia vera]